MHSKILKLTGNNCHSACSAKTRASHVRATQYWHYAARTYPWLAAALIALVLFSRPASASACEGIERITTATPHQLFDYALQCKDLTKAVLLMYVGQVRALTDLEAFPAQGEADTAAMAELYRRFYYEMGGSGPERVFTDQETYQSLVEGLSQWSPDDLKSYEPGWQYASAPSYEGYRQLVAKYIEFRLSQLSRYHLLVNDPEYQRINPEITEILKRNNNQLVEGTEDAERYRELSKKVDEIRARLRESLGEL
ncbi:MAG: hypothetical protein AAF270_10635 [Pseudomonadota bacterium]